MIGRHRRLAVLPAVLLAATGSLLALPAVAAAQPREKPVRIAVYGTAGVFSATAKDSFSAILDKESGTDIGAGAQIALQTGMLRGLFVQVDASRFEETGERVFVHDREVFPLGIPLTIGLTPIEVSAGYRFNPARRVRGATNRSRFAVFAGGGVGSVGYKELDDAEAFNERFTAYHVMGGADVTVWKLIQVGAEVRYRTVPDSLGVGGVSDEFNETDLGGTTIRVRFGIAF
jgi:hypothetical protein